MFKYSLLILFLSVLLNAEGIDYAVSNKHSYLLQKNNLDIKASYLKVNDTLDVLNLKEKQFNNLGSIGDMDGYSLELRYGISAKDSIFTNLQRWNVNYGDSTLKNNKYDIFNRYQIVKNSSSFFNSLLFDLGFEQNSASPIVISSDTSLNALIKKIKPNSNIKVDNGDIISGDSRITVYDKNGNKIYPYITINHLKSNSYYGRIMLGKQFTNYSFLDLYIGYKYTQITTAVSFYPDNSLIRNMIKDYNIKDMNRNEQNLNLGFYYLLQIGKFIGEFNYEYNKLFRDTDVSYNDTSHTIDASISTYVTKNILVYIGGRLMMEQFNTDIPYLYNKYTKTQFDHKYGFAKFGLLYKFR